MIGLLALAAASTVQPGALKTFSDWTAGCDNIRHCEAVALMPDVTEGDWSAMILERDAEPLAPVKASLADYEDAKAVTAAIDGGATIIRFTPGKGDAAASVTLDTTLIAKMRNASFFELRDAAGKVVGRVSLKGMTAALRYIDDQQKRVNTVTALIATGPGPAASVPKPPLAPVIVRAPAVPAAAPLPSKAMMARMAKSGQCEGEEGGHDASAYRIDAKTVLVLVPCGSGAYNFSSAPVLLRGTSFTLASFDSPVGFGEEGGPPMLVNADWDPKTRTLSSFAKGRGLGDCGTSAEFAWDGARFRLIEQHEMGECRGSPDWIRTWKANVR